MNILVLGLPRNGKTLYTMDQLCQELRLGQRPIITNIAVEKFPWVTRKHETRRGLISYLEEKYEKDFNCRERIFRIDEAAMKYFYLYRALNRHQVELLTEKGLHLKGYREVTLADGVMEETEFLLHKDLKLYVADHETRIDKNGKKIVTGFNSALVQVSGGHMNAADECWRFWAARSWQSTSEPDIWYNAQHGKLGDDNFFITHRDNDIDSVIVERCQESRRVTHCGKLRFGKFRQPNNFTVDIYNGRPMPSKEPRTEKFSLDAKGLAQTYDTSGGVGISGRGVADTGARLSGLPFWMIPVLGVLAIVAALFIYHYGMIFIHTAFNSKKTVPAHTAVPASPVAASSHNDQGKVRSIVSDETSSAGSFAAKVAYLGDSPDDTNDVYCTGYMIFTKDDVEVFFSDGSVAYSSDGEVQQIEHHWVRAFGRRYRIIQLGQNASAAPVSPMPSFSQPQVLNSQPQVSEYSDESTVHILPSIHSAASAIVPAQRINGFSSRGVSQIQNQGAAEN